MEDKYLLGGAITGIIVFFGIWIYAFASWGFLIGLAIGWLPAIIGAIIAGLLWPVILIILVIALLLFFVNVIL